jgi:hypothetical protein
VLEEVQKVNKFKMYNEELARQYQNKSKSELMDIAININKGWTVDEVETAKYILKSKYNEEIQENVLELYSSRSDTNKQPTQFNNEHKSILTGKAYWYASSFIFFSIVALFTLLIMVFSDRLGLYPTLWFRWSAFIPLAFLSYWFWKLTKNNLVPDAQGRKRLPSSVRIWVKMLITVFVMIIFTIIAFIIIGFLWIGMVNPSFPN